MVLLLVPTIVLTTMFTLVIITITMIVSGQNKRGHHFVWPAVYCSRGFMPALGFCVTPRATPAGSCGALGLLRTLHAISRGCFVNPASLRGGSQRSLGFAEPWC